MSNVRKIVNYFFHHRFSDEMVDRVHQRLVTPDSEDDKEEALQSVWDEIGFPEVSSEEALRAFSKVDQKIGLGKQPEKQRLSFRIPVWARIAAVWSVPVLILSASYYMYKEAKVVKDAVANMSFVEHYAPEGKRLLVTLPDSSKVWLNSGTLLVHPSSFLGNDREIYLAGEGYFDVRKNTEQPFIVKTSALQVQVLGTKFNLSAYPDADKITTTLEQGAVKVLLDQLSPSGQSFALVPNEQLIYIPATGVVEKQTVTPADYSEWKAGGLFFSNSTFRDIVKTLERVYNIRIHMQISTYNENRLTIHFNKNESLENVMMLIKEMVPGLEYQIDGNDLYMR